MNKKAKKLRLHLETLRALDLHQVVAGTFLSQACSAGTCEQCGFSPGDLTYGCTDRKAFMD